MGTNGIPMDKAELLSVILEAILYGFSLLMFGGTIWVLFFRSSNRQVNRKMLAAACTFLVLSTTHLIVHIIRVVDAFCGDSHPGGISAFFENTSQWTFWAKNYIYVTQSLVGDGVILYRCYSVWQSKLVMILPMLLWSATAVTGYVATHIESQVIQDKVFGGDLGKWITAYWTVGLSTNLVATVLFAWRIWYFDWKLRKLAVGRKSELRPILRIVVDSGLIYSLTLLATLICFVNKNDGHYVVLDMVTPIISITFYMVIVRVGLASLTNRVVNMSTLEYASPRFSATLNQRSTGVPVATFTGNKVDDSLYSSTVLGIQTSIETRWQKIELDGMSLGA